MYLAKPDSRTPYYQIVYFVNGARKTKSTKERLKSKALNYLSRFEIEIHKESTPLNISLEEFTIEYLAHLRVKFSEKYLRINEDTFRALKEHLSGEVRLTDIRLSDIENFILIVFSKAKYSAYLHFRNLRASFNYALNRNYIKQNILQGYTFPKLPKSNPVFITDIELKQILSRVENDTLRDMYLCYYHTGTRLNELIHLKWKNVDLLQGVIRIKNSDDFSVKTKEERLIPLNNVTSEIFRKRFPHIIDLDGYVFTKKGFKYNGDYVSKHFKKASRLAGFPDIHTHILRHSFCSNLIKSNISPRVVMELAGHSNLSTALKYMHVRNESLFEAVRVLES